MEESVDVSRARLRSYERLVDELMCEDFDAKEVQKMMSELGLEYSDDPIVTINRVLMALHEEK